MSTAMQLAKLTPTQITTVELTVFDLVLAHLPENFFLVAVELEKNAGQWALQIFIDKSEAKISLQDCEMLSRLLDPLIDELPLPLNAYSLEVSSPGIFRPLKTAREFEFYNDRSVCFDPGDGQKHVTGKLIGFSNNVLQLELDGGKTQELDLTEQALVTLNPKLEDKTDD